MLEIALELEFSVNVNSLDISIEVGNTVFKEGFNQYDNQFDFFIYVKKTD